MLLKYKLPNGENFFYRENKNDISPIKEVFEGNHYKKIFPKLKEGARVLDLGAHIGSFTKFCNLLGCETVSYEPNSENFELLSKNCKDNFIFKKAVTNEKSNKLTFYFNDKNTKDSYRFTKIKTPRYNGEIIIENEYFENLLDIHFDVVKMDIEGSEFGIIDSEKMFNCDVLFMEYHFSKDKDMKNFRKRISILKKHFKTVSCHPYLLEEGKFDNDRFAYKFDEFVYCEK